jgi:hypothetical protein
MYEAWGFKDFVNKLGILCEMHEAWGFKDFVYKLGRLCEMHEVRGLAYSADNKCSAARIGGSDATLRLSLIGCPAKLPRGLVLRLNVAEGMLTCASNYRTLF